MIDKIRNEPARAYAVVVAALALIGTWVSNLPIEGILGVVAAVLAFVGGQEVAVRRNVYPAAHVAVSAADLAELDAEYELEQGLSDASDPFDTSS